MTGPGRTVYFDLETGGVEARHPDIQLAAVAIEDGTWREVDAFESKILFDPSKADPNALALNHYRAEEWAAAPPEWEVAREFGKFLQRHATLQLTSRAGRPYHVAKLIGHNAATFDGPRLRAMFARHSAFCPADFRVRDTLQLALWHFDRTGLTPPENFKLGTLCKHFGVPVEEAHEALADVRLTVALARALCDATPTGKAA